MLSLLTAPRFFLIAFDLNNAVHVRPFFQRVAVGTWFLAELLPYQTNDLSSGPVGASLRENGSTSK